jgi:hypothetical protein
MIRIAGNMPASEIEREILIQVLKSRLDTHYHSAMEASIFILSIGVALLALGVTLFFTGKEKDPTTWFGIGAGIGLFMAGSRFYRKIPYLSRKEQIEMKRQLAQLQEEERI